MRSFGFRDQGLKEFWGLVQDFGFRVQGFRIEGSGFGFRITKSSKHPAKGSFERVQGLLRLGLKLSSAAFYRGSGIWG